MIIRSDNVPTEIHDIHITVTCPHCGVRSNISAVSIPRFEYLLRFTPKTVGIAYCCDNCKYPVFLRYTISSYSDSKIFVEDAYEEVEKAKETFEFKFLPPTVANDFQEALTCYSNVCYNAFAAMCRRCIQSVFMELGAKGKDRVMQQLEDVRTTANIDDETYNMLEQVVISGHDGAHPHLPKLSMERAAVLLELMKDILYQLFVRQAKIQEAIGLRQQDIIQGKNR
jgi:hypothetical protein